MPATIQDPTDNGHLTTKSAKAGASVPAFALYLIEPGLTFGSELYHLGLRPTFKPGDTHSP